MEIDIEPDADRRPDVHDRLRARHLRAPGLHRGARASGAPRRSHRPAEPQPVRRPHGSRDRVRRPCRASSAPCCWSTSTGSSEVNDDARTREGRRHPPGGRRPAARRDARRRHRRASGRRRVRRSCRPAQTDRGSRRGDRLEDPRGVRPPVPDHRGDRRRVGASIGIALFPEHGHTTADLLRRADLACTRPSAPARASPCSCAEHEDRTSRRLTLLNELRDGIPRGELILHYQPKIDLGRAGARPASRRSSAGSTRPRDC